MNPKYFHNKITRSFPYFQFCCLNTEVSISSNCSVYDFGFSCLFPAAWHHHDFLFSSNSHYLGSSILYLFQNTVLELRVHFLSSPILKYTIPLLSNPVSLSHNPTLVAYLGMVKVPGWWPSWAIELWNCLDWKKLLRSSASLVHSFFAHSEFLTG